MSDDFMRWLSEDCGYLAPVLLRDGRWIAVEVRAFNTRIVTGTIGDRASIDDGW